MTAYVQASGVSRNGNFKSVSVQAAAPRHQHAGCLAMPLLSALPPPNLPQAGHVCSHSLLTPLRFSSTNLMTELLGAISC